MAKALFTMYPDWPESADDLVPLPTCDGPKLKPFDFQGPQKIEFLEYLTFTCLESQDSGPDLCIETHKRRPNYPHTYGAMN